MAVEESSIQQIILNKPKLILVEGIEDKYFFEKLISIPPLDQMAIDIQIELYGGKDKMGNAIKAIPRLPNFKRLKSIIITRDADESLDSTLQSIQYYLQRANLPVPNANKEYATSPTDNLKAGIFILPGNLAEGMLEDLLLSATAAGNLRDCIDQYIDCVKNHDKNLPRNESKARFFSWLSLQAEPNKRLEFVISQTKLIPWDSPVFNDIKNFLSQI